jgi:hypothetical protein
MRSESFSPLLSGSAAGRTQYLLLVGLFLASRMSVYLVLALTSHHLSLEGTMKLLCRWDCGWYLHSIERGYDPAPWANPAQDEANWAFFPLFIVIGRFLYLTLNISPLAAGFLVANAAALGAGLMARWLIPDRRTWLCFIVLLYFGPFSFYFVTAYTESLFVCLTIACFYFIARRAYMPAAIACALLSATRAVGVFMVVALALAMVADHIRQGGKLSGFPRALIADPWRVFAILVAPLGLFAYMVYLYCLVGDGLAFSHIQRAWGRDFGNPVLRLIEALRTPDIAVIRWGGVSGQWNAFWVLPSLVPIGSMLWRRRYPEAIFSIICVLVPLSTGVLSMPRFIAGIAPITIEWSRLISARVSVAIVSLGLVVAADLPLLIFWSESKPMLY